MSDRYRIVETTPGDFEFSEWVGWIRGSWIMRGRYTTLAHAETAMRALAGKSARKPEFRYDSQGRSAGTS